MSACREEFGLQGMVTDFGHVREWSSGHQAREAMPIHVRLESDEDGNHFSIRQYVQPMKTLALIAPIAIAGIALTLGTVGFFVGFTPALISVMVGMTGLAGLTAIPSVLLTRRWSRKQLDRFTGLGERAARLSAAAAE